MFPGPLRGPSGALPGLPGTLWEPVLGLGARLEPVLGLLIGFLALLAALGFGPFRRLRWWCCGGPFAGGWWRTGRGPVLCGFSYGK